MCDDEIYLVSNIRCYKDINKIPPTTPNEIG